MEGLEISGISFLICKMRRQEQAPVLNNFIYICIKTIFCKNQNRTPLPTQMTLPKTIASAAALRWGNLFK